MPPNYINQKEFLQSKCANLQARRSHTDGYVDFAYSFFFVTNIGLVKE